jgi:hypothetical protein
MKRNAWIGTMALMFALGVAVPAHAQEAGHEDAKPAESKPAEAKPAEAKPEAKPATHATAKPATHTVTKSQEAKPDEAKREDAKPAEHAENKPAPKPEAKPTPKPKPAPSHNDVAHNDAEHRDAAKPAARENTHATTRNVAQKNDPHRIPEDKYRANFGREHTFHVGHPVNEGGRYRFAYGGYNFYYTQAWPAGWGYDDDVYVVEINGVYYLEDVVHPGVQLALTIDL